MGLSRLQRHLTPDPQHPQQQLPQRPAFTGLLPLLQQWTAGLLGPQVPRRLPVQHGQRLLPVHAPDPARLYLLRGHLGHGPVEGPLVEAGRQPPIRARLRGHDRLRPPRRLPQRLEPGRARARCRRLHPDQRRHRGLRRESRAPDGRGDERLRGPVESGGEHDRVATLLAWLQPGHEWTRPRDAGAGRDMREEHTADPECGSGRVLEDYGALLGPCWLCARFA